MGKTCAKRLPSAGEGCQPLRSRASRTGCPSLNALLSADADAVCRAEWGQRTAERTNQRNGYRQRTLDTRVGTIDVAVPKLRQGTYFPEWLLERRKRAESALITVVADCYLAGVSTRRMDKLVKTLGINALSKSQVSPHGSGPR